MNGEFSALETFLRNLPACLNAGGRVAILTFHSGEDRRVKKSFAEGLRAGVYAEIARDVVRPSAVERHANPRSTSAKRSNGSPLCRSPRYSPGPRCSRSRCAITKPSVFS